MGPVRIICDTNIWYNLGAGTIHETVAEQNCLVATYYNFDELNTTYNILKDADKVIKTAKAIVDFSSAQILENSILYLVQTIDKYFSDERYSYSLGMRSWHEVRCLARLSTPSCSFNKIFSRYISRIH